MKREVEQPLDRALAILDAVAGADGALSMTEIAQRCRLPLATVHRIVAQLEQRALLKRVLGSKRLLVGPRLVKLGAQAVAAAARWDRVHAILESLAQELGEHCQLGMRSGNEVVYLDTARAARSTGLHFEQGNKSPLHCCSTGKLFLAEMEPPELEAWLDSAPLPALTQRTIVSKRALKASLSEIREKGWAASNEEMAVGVVGCAVPVRMSNGTLVAGLGISVPSALTPFTELPRFLPSMQKAAAALAKTIEG